MPICPPAPTSAKSAATASSARRRTSITPSADRLDLFEGPLRPRAFDAEAAGEPGDGEPHLGRAAPARQCALPICASGRAGQRCRRLRAMPTATCCCSSMQGAASLFCDFGHLTYRDGDYILSAARHDVAAGAGSADERPADRGDQRLLTSLPDRGILGPHAIFDPAALETPKLDDAFPRSAARRRMAGAGQAPRRDLHHHLSVQSAGCRGLEGQSRAVKLNWRDIRPVMSHRYHISASRAFDLRRRPFRGLHLRAAAHRKRSRRAQSAVLPFQRRLSTK